MKKQKQELLAELAEIKKITHRDNYEAAKIRTEKISTAVDEQRIIYSKADAEDNFDAATAAYQKLRALKAKKEQSEKGLEYFRRLAAKNP